MAEPTITDLRTLRKAVGLSQRKVAELVGVATSTVGNWESGDTCPTPANLAAYANAVGWSESQIARPPATVARGAAPPPVSWQEWASCRGAERELFFAPDSQLELQAKAKSYCHDCAVREDCLDWALTWGSEQQGIAGGLTAGERKSYRRRLNRGSLQAEAS